MATRLEANKKGWQRHAASRLVSQVRRQLPVSTTVAAPSVSAPTVESVAPVKSTSSVSVEAPASPHDATVISATRVTMAVCSMGIASRISTNVAVSVTPAWVTPCRMSPVARVTPISAMTPAPVIPRSHTNEDSANEPPRAVETVRGAGIRVIGIVPIGTRGRTASISRAGKGLIVFTVWIALIAWALISWTLVSRSLILTLILLALILTLILLALILTLILLALVRVTWVVSSSRISLRVRVSHRQRQRREQCKMLYVSHLTPLCQTRRSSNRIRKPSGNWWSVDAFIALVHCPLSLCI
jgi:hypothetical protein